MLLSHISSNFKLDARAANRKLNDLITSHKARDTAARKATGTDNEVYRMRESILYLVMKCD